MHFNPLPPHGGRHRTVYIKVDGCYFNPLPPHGGRPHCSAIALAIPGFQSTPSAWRETRRHCARNSMSNHFNPLPPHGGRLFVPREKFIFNAISIHSLRMEGDRTAPKSWQNTIISIHSLRMEGDGNVPQRHRCRGEISIHSLRMEGDSKLTAPRRKAKNFNPLPPHGGRLCNTRSSDHGRLFQSTPSAWRETGS